jgi:uncharacterized protein YjeT (DUF2065 family)
MSLAPGARDFVTAVGLVLVIEGGLYALAPGAMKRMFEAARNWDDGVFRTTGLGAALLGLAVVWMIRG